MRGEDILTFREGILQLQRHLSRQLKTDAKCCGITTAQCHALMELGARGELSLVRLAHILGLDKSTLSRTIEGMVQSGLVERQANSQDRRAVAIALTAQGQSLYNQIDDTISDYFHNLFSLIPEEKRGQVLESLSLLSQVVGELTGIECCGGGIQGLWKDKLRD